MPVLSTRPPPGLSPIKGRHPVALDGRPYLGTALGRPSRGSFGRAEREPPPRGENCGLHSGIVRYALKPGQLLRSTCVPAMDGHAVDPVPKQTVPSGRRVRPRGSALARRIVSIGDQHVLTRGSELAWLYAPSPQLGCAAKASADTRGRQTEGGRGTQFPGASRPGSHATSDTASYLVSRRTKIPAHLPTGRVRELARVPSGSR